MIEAYNNLYVGSQFDYDSIVQFQTSWAIVNACTEPYHREALAAFKVIYPNCNLSRVECLTMLRSIGINIIWIYNND